jgi:hypothetical protein
MKTEVMLQEIAEQRRAAGTWKGVRLLQFVHRNGYQAGSPLEELTSVLKVLARWATARPVTSK